MCEYDQSDKPVTRKFHKQNGHLQLGMEWKHL